MGPLSTRLSASLLCLVLCGSLLPSPAAQGRDADLTQSSGHSGDSSRQQAAPRGLDDAKTPAAVPEGKSDEKAPEAVPEAKSDKKSPEAVPESKSEEKSPDAAKKQAYVEEKMDGLEEKTAAQEETISSLRAQVDKLSAQKSALEKEKTDLEKAKSDVEKEKATLADNVTSLTATVSKLNSEMSTKAAINDQAQADLKATIASKENEVSESKASIASKEKELDESKATIASKQNELDGSKATIASKEKQVTKLEDDLKKNEKKANDDLVEADNTFKALDAEHNKLHEEHNLLTARYADPSVQHFLRAKAVKVYQHPGIQGAKNKAFIYIVPSLEKRYNASMKLAQSSKSIVYSKLNAFVGTEKIEPWLPAASGVLVYGGVILPFICSVCCLTRIICKLRPLLLFCHLDFFLTTLCAGIFALYTKKEPLAAFAHHDGSVYLFTQVIIGVAFCLYFLLLCCGWCRATGGTLEGCYRICQIIGATPIALTYFSHVWTPAMLDEMPQMDRVVGSMIGLIPGAKASQFAWLPYLPASVLFLVLLRLERLCWYAAAGSAKNAAGQDQMSVVMRNDVELATIIGGAPEAAELDLEKSK